MSKYTSIQTPRGGSFVRRDDGAYIPNDPLNTDYQEYQEFQANPNAAARNKANPNAAFNRKQDA